MTADEALRAALAVHRAAKVWLASRFQSEHDLAASRGVTLPPRELEGVKGIYGTDVELSWSRDLGDAGVAVGEVYAPLAELRALIEVELGGGSAPP